MFWIIMWIGVVTCWLSCGLVAARLTYVYLDRVFPGQAGIMDDEDESLITAAFFAGPITLVIVGGAWLRRRVLRLVTRPRQREADR